MLMGTINTLLKSSNLTPKRNKLKSNKNISKSVFRTLKKSQHIWTPKMSVMISLILFSALKTKERMPIFQIRIFIRTLRTVPPTQARWAHRKDSCRKINLQERKDRQMLPGTHPIEVYPKSILEVLKHHQFKSNPPAPLKMNRTPIWTNITITDMVREL